MSHPVLGEKQVLEILDKLKSSIHQHIIAKEYGVSKKTISRISTGESWVHITRQNKYQDSIKSSFSTTNDVCNILDDIVAIKNSFGFNFKQPIYWGWFENWDGIHSIASDGYIAWESDNLVKYAQFLVSTGINDPPIYANRAEELPTFELEDLMTQPIGEQCRVNYSNGDVTKLTCNTNKTMYIKQRYVNIATKLQLSLHSLEGNAGFVYLTKSKTKDPVPTVIACITTLKET